MYMNHRILIIFISLTVAACQNKEQADAGAPGAGGPGAAPQAVPVNVEAVQQEDAVYYEQFPGTVTALNEVQLRGEVSGYITGIFFKDGQTVKKGQKLYEIDRSRYAAAYQQAAANVQIAKANLERVQRDTERYNRLGEQDAIARQIVDNAQTDLKNAQLQVTSAQANTTTAQTNLSYSLITAPFDGTIGISQVKLGTLVTPGQTLLNTVSTDNPIALDVEIDEKNISRFLKLSKQTSGAKGDSTFTLLLPGEELYPETGEMLAIDRAVNPQTGTLKLRMQFPNPERRLRVGMNCNARVLNRESENQILIPFRAVTEQMSEYFVYVVKNNKVAQRKIAVGPNIREKIVVTDGLKPGEQIVVDGIQKLRDGATIQPQTASNKQANTGSPQAAGR